MEPSDTFTKMRPRDSGFSPCYLSILCDINWPASGTQTNKQQKKDFCLSKICLKTPLDLFFKFCIFMNTLVLPPQGSWLLQNCMENSIFVLAASCQAQKTHSTNHWGRQANPQDANFRLRSPGSEKACSAASHFRFKLCQTGFPKLHIPISLTSANQTHKVTKGLKEGKDH